jgi:hypothetical protein
MSNQQPDLIIVISVGIFDDFQRMSMSNHREVREVIIFEEGGGGMILGAKVAGTGS